MRVTVDHNGLVVSYDDYDPWGMVLEGRSGNSGDANDKIKFTGKERDKETNYDYFGARYYDSRIGRWLSVDPLSGLHPDYTPFAYVYNNPMLLVDPDGKDSIQLKMAVDDAKDYVKHNPNRDPKLYDPEGKGKTGAKGGPGKASDCSGLTSHGVKKAGMPDPAAKGVGRGVERSVQNTTQVIPALAKPGNLVVSHGNKHIGTLVSVENVEGSMRFNVVHSGSTTGPVETGFFKPGDQSYWGRNFNSVRAWDSPEMVPNVVSRADATHQSPTVPLTERFSIFE